MLISELSAATGVAVPTIKYYLREELLPPGVATAATRAEYGDAHLERLRLIRALVGVAAMSLPRVREVLAVVDDASADVPESVGAAHMQLSPLPAQEPSEHSRQRVARLIAGRRWRPSEDSRHAQAVAAALDAMDAVGQPLTDEALVAYGEGADLAARADLSAMGERGPVESTTFAVIGTVLSDPVYLGVRRLAQEAHSLRRRPRKRS